MALVRIANLENLDDLAQVVAELRGGEPTARQAGAAIRGTQPTSADRGVSASPKKKGDLAPESAPAGANSNSPAPRAVASFGELNDETVAAIWKEALVNLGDMHREYASSAESVGLAGSDRLLVTFRGAKYNLHKSVCEEPDRLAKLEAALGEVAGRPLSVSFALIDDAEPAGAAPRAGVSNRQRMAERAEHPLVRRAAELFDAHMVRVDQPDQ
jgi:hypothetical protein